ncbi:hypothetical protein RB2501_13834 [Robiginitalea biformata HTCC2501]|uniref:Uncharacterized protein n=2 Tax=Robiginitalea TaxID=252306 RepID=A4CKL4_ROBBH|nr:hypothetical protein RB2501_13834 [Robiginitalea biformata HTCC2501]
MVILAILIALKTEPMENENQEGNLENSKASNTELADVLKDFLNGKNFEKIIEAITEGNRDHKGLKRVHSESNLTYWRLRFRKEAAVIFVILIAICLLSMYDKIENDTLGTLLGSVIGYAIGNFSLSSKN